jgi:SAP domain-containing new25/Domain of unknown function (DUF6434)
MEDVINAHSRRNEGMTDRPPLDSNISAEDFKAFYWLKEELMGFCRGYGLPTSGSKQVLTERIVVFLTTGSAPVPKPAAKRRSVGKMPERFTREMVIGSGWRCSQALRAFFLQEIGPQFHFNSVMRDFIKDGAGRTLQEAIAAWEAERSQPKTEKEIAPQFEYNRHFREYFKTHPGATREEAIAAWKVKRAQRKD